MKYILAQRNRPLLRRLARAHTLLVFDFDGTLAPIVPDPKGAAIRPHTAALLRQVAEVYPVAILSGRALADVTPRLIAAMRDVPKVCEWFHLPLQSGSDRVLERMNRGYTRAQYLDLVAALRDAVPELALSTDLIVGFPGETEADFEATLDMVERVHYDNVYAFRYSRRPGTPAAEMPDQIDDAVKAARNARLLDVVTRVTGARSARLAGQVVDVLVDGTSKRNAGEVTGRTRCNRVVNFDGRGRVAMGDVVAVRVTEVLPHSLRATLTTAPEEVVCSSR